MHGAASGIDTWAGEIAERIGLQVESYPADWNTHGKKAGFLRNLEMLSKEPFLVLAYQSKNSRGTQHTVDNAKERDIQTVVTKFG